MTEKTLFDEAIEMTYYNTTSLSGPDLQEHKFRAGMLNDRVYRYMQTQPYDNHTRFEIWKKLGIRNNPETSIGRSLTDLKDLKLLEKCDGKEGRPKVQRKGRYGAVQYCYRLK